MLRRLLPYWYVAARETVLGTLLLLTAAALELLQPWPVKWLMDYVFTRHAAPAWLAALWPAFRTHNASGSIMGICVAILALALVYRLTHTLSQLLLIRAGARLASELRCHVSDHLHRLSLSYHDRVKVGDSLYRAAYDTQAAQSLLSGAVVPIVTGVLILVGILGVMLRMDAVLTLTAVIMLPAFWLTIHGFGKGIEKDADRRHRHESGLVSLLQESLSSIRAVQAFTREDDTDRRFRAQSCESLAANDRLTRLQLVFSACVGLVMAAGTTIIVGIGAHRVLAGRLLPGDILVFLAYLGMLYQPMNAFSQSASIARSAGAQLKRAFEVLDEQPEIAERAGARPLSGVAGGIEFRSVGFQYDPDAPVLRGIDLSVQPGQAIALVGRTGAGKTTLIHLLLRFYDPTQGAILLDGHDLRDLPLTWLRRQISIVLQDPILFSGSIRDNIAYACPGASQAQIEKAARQAQAEEFILALPDNYETQLGERGVNLSGGQRQRLAIARAFLKDAPILILDEPTSALDSHTEADLLEALQRLMQGRTTFIIAHRLSTVRRADTILVLQEGRVMEQGSHETLIRGDTLYHRLVHSQWGNHNDSSAALLEPANPLAGASAVN